MINFKSFKHKSIEYYMKNNYEFNVSKNIFKIYFTHGGEILNYLAGIVYSITAIPKIILYI